MGIFVTCTKAASSCQFTKPTGRLCHNGTAGTAMISRRWLQVFPETLLSITLEFASLWTQEKKMKTIKHQQDKMHRAWWKNQLPVWRTGNSQGRVLQHFVPTREEAQKMIKQTIVPKARWLVEAPGQHAAKVSWHVACVNKRIRSKKKTQGKSRCCIGICLLLDQQLHGSSRFLRITTTLNSTLNSSLQHANNQSSITENTPLKHAINPFTTSSPNPGTCVTEGLEAARDLCRIVRVTEE